MVCSLQQPGARVASVLRVKPAGDSSLPAPASPPQSSTVVRLPTVRTHRERRGTGGCYQAPARRRSSCQTLAGRGGGFTGGLHLLFLRSGCAGDCSDTCPARSGSDEP